MESYSGRSAELEFACRDGDPITYWQMVVEPRLAGFQRPPDDKEKVRILKSLVRLRAGFVNAVDPQRRDLHGTQDPQYCAELLEHCDQQFMKALGVLHVA
ncbi:hypothetical protein [Orrella marina]|uniref:Uncharacterized protein n=1 Tax=Orrella marina TaxID=2163011 RepID=A0A2R4XIY3_9BURK|nr:hypothetical protein [Orrella marina]AWB33713.1 hypothetical protein DBV39_08375 [Orrella marina]